MIARVQQDFGRLDILVNNVGIQYVAPVHEVWECVSHSHCPSCSLRSLRRLRCRPLPR